MKIKNLILDILFPKFCLGCGKEGKYICDKCKLFVSETMPVCPVCYKSSFFGETHSDCLRKYGLDGLTSIWDYDGLIKKIIYMIKYDGLTHAIDECVESSFKLIAEDINRFYSFLSFLSSDNGCITYVPMHIKKEKKRGFNQAEIIAKKIGKVSSRRVVSLLRKTIDTKNQTKLDREERLENIKNCFQFCDNWDKLSLSQNLILVDDVFTSGATMKECCKVLKQAGIKKVWGFTLARTP